MTIVINDTNFLSRRAKRLSRTLGDDFPLLKVLDLHAWAYGYPTWRDLRRVVETSGIIRPFDQDLSPREFAQARIKQAAFIRLGLGESSLERGLEFADKLEATRDFSRPPAPMRLGESAVEFARHTWTERAWPPANSRPALLSVGASDTTRLSPEGDLVATHDASPDAPAVMIAALKLDAHVACRFFARYPSTEELVSFVGSVLKEAKAAEPIVWPVKKEMQESPHLEGLRGHFQVLHGPGYGREAVRHRQWVDERFLKYLHFLCAELGETGPSLTELEASYFDPTGLCPRRGILYLPTETHFDRANVTRHLAEGVCRLRHRDPETGQHRRKEVPPEAPRNTSRGAAGTFDRDDAAVRSAQIYSKYLPADFAATLADDFRAQRSSNGASEEALLCRIKRTVEQVVFNPWESLETYVKYQDIDMLAQLLHQFGELSEEARLIRISAGRMLSGPLRHPSRPGQDLHLFALGVLVLDSTGQPTALLGLPAHKQVEEMLAKTLASDAMVTFDPQLHIADNKPLTMEYARWTRHVAHGAKLLLRPRESGWMSGSRTPHTPASALIRGRPHDIGAEHILTVAMIVPEGVGPNYSSQNLGEALRRCGEVVNEKLRKWGASNEVRFGSFFTYGDDLKLRRRAIPSDDSPEAVS